MNDQFAEEKRSVNARIERLQGLITQINFEISDFENEIRRMTEACNVQKKPIQQMISWQEQENEREERLIRRGGDWADRVRARKSEIALKQAKINSLEAQLEKDISVLRESIATLTEQKTKYEAEIKNCLDYLSFGKQAAGTISKDEVSDTVFFPCPSCGRAITGSRKELLKIGRVICSNCHTQIQVTNKNQ